MYKIIVVSPKDEDVIEKCEEIALNKAALNFKTYQDIGLFNQASFLICALDEKSNIIGYAALFENLNLKGNLHIAQLAIDVKYANKNVEELIIKYILNHSFSYKNITTNLNIKDIETQNIYKKMGFEVLFNGINSTRMIIDTQKLLNTLTLNFSKAQEDFIL